LFLNCFYYFNVLFASL